MTIFLFLEGDEVLRGNGATIGKEVPKGVKDLRATSCNVQMAVRTVPEVQASHTEVTVVTSNEEFW